ncbi:MAG: oxygen-independent coproporphyrinogen III oxidase [Deltaproteobacteria bacterium]|jgi:oxygen-independent coproporphyrinogen-3 oxidase
MPSSARGPLIERYDVPAPRYTSYPTVPAWSDDFGPAQFRAALARIRPDEAVGLYVHLPFCEARCAFCGCNVTVTKNRARADKYLDTVEAEARLLVEAIGHRPDLRAMHWGGGTPTFLTIPQLERALRIVADTFALQGDADLSIEVDPRVTTIAQLTALRRFGFTRVSMGIQDFDPLVQNTIAREHPVNEVAKLVTAVQDLGYAGLNFDLIYGLPHQTTASWATTLENVVALLPDRIATYAFAHLPARLGHQRRLPIAEIPFGAEKLALYEQAYERLTSAGYVAIGMDHFARVDDPLAIAAEAGTLNRTFQGYTVDPPDSTVGLGVTSISDVGGAYAQNEPQLQRYTECIERGELATIRGHVRDAEDNRRADLIRDLLCRFETELYEDLEPSSDLERMIDDGVVELDGRRLAVTPLGRPFVRNVAMTLDPYAQPGQGSRSV